jgi:hypothetical protein
MSWQEKNTVEIKKSEAKKLVEIEVSHRIDSKEALIIFSKLKNNIDSVLKTEEYKSYKFKIHWFTNSTGAALSLRNYGDSFAVDYSDTLNVLYCSLDEFNLNIISDNLPQVEYLQVYEPFNNINRLKEDLSKFSDLKGICFLLEDYKEEYAEIVKEFFPECIIYPDNE